VEIRKLPTVVFGGQEAFRDAHEHGAVGHSTPSDDTEVVLMHRVGQQPRRHSRSRAAAVERIRSGQAELGAVLVAFLMMQEAAAEHRSQVSDTKTEIK